MTPNDLSPAAGIGLSVLLCAPFWGIVIGLFAWAAP